MLSQENVLFKAVCYNEISVVKSLLEQGVKPNETKELYDLGNFTCLQVAAKYNFTEVMELLMQSNADIDE
ncbi:MAG: ankyrin repeat domain-containing protein [Alphaproteobacteria bacterium]|nr:ankyrin repeat domain-containing protein [Alphaproteobacteria bacterium]OJV13497.1 MAG: hypothetical protein BGO27_04745 [Alphaproteobacteria bacterium 33-17]